MYLVTYTVLLYVKYREEIILKRILIITVFFCALLAILCILSCGGPNQCRFACDSLTVATYDSCSAESANGTASMQGCHIANSCIDCYWFPTACGNYENDLGTVSNVVCGWDCTFGECYGDSALNSSEEESSDFTPNIETRSVVEAQEGVHYTVGKMSVRMYDGELKGFEDGSLDNWDDLKSLIGLISMTGEETEIQLTLEYTALKELSGVVFSGDVIYDGYNWTNYTHGFNMKDGNGANSSETQAKLNIQPGKHVINAVISLNFYEMAQLQDITNITFTAYTYSEG